MNKPAISIIIDIIIKYMDLENIQCYIWSQKNQIVPNKLNVSVQFMNSKTFSNTRKYKEILDNQNLPIGYQEVNTIRTREEYQIDIFAFDNQQGNEALSRYSEVQLALNSDYAIQQQEKYAFQIGITSSFISTTEIEGAEQIKRFTLTVPILTWYEKTKPVKYYNQFNAPSVLIEQ